MLDVRNKQDLELAKQWLNNMLNTLADGGRWAIPRSGTLVEIDKVNKIANITYGGNDPSIKVVFEAIGYKCNILPNKGPVSCMPRSFL